MKTRAKRVLLLIAPFLVLPAATLPVRAQETPQIGPAEEIIVTARKREESILQTPVIESAITGAALEQYATPNIEDLAAHVPDLLFGEATGAFGAQVSLRGVGTSTLNATIDQSVSLNLDGLQVSQGLAYQAGLFDVAQAEVLKGPQALFYGKASPGGVISLHSNDPTQEFEIMAQDGYDFEAGQEKGVLIVSGPVSDTLMLRLATSISGMDGFFENNATGVPSLGGLSPHFRNFAPTDEDLVRGTVLWKPSPLFDLKLKVNFDQTNVDGDGGGLEVTSCPGEVTNGLGIPFLDPKQPCALGRDFHLVDLNPADYSGVRNGGIPFSQLGQGYGTLEANYRPVQGLTLTSVTGFYMMHQADLINGTLTEAAGPPIAADNNFHRRDASEEFRVTSDFPDSPVNFTLGAFVQDGKIDNNINLLANTALGLPPVLQRGSYAVNVDSQSAFGQLLWKALPDVELSGGARWTHEDRTVALTDLLGPAPVLVPTLQPVISSYHLNPEFSVTYTPSSDLTLYGSYKEASKSGSFSTTTVVAPNSDIAFGDEGVSGGEAGVKGYALDRALRFNLDGYYYDYTNLQVGTNVVTDGIISEETLNAASAEIYGIELDGSYRVPVVAGLTVNSGLDWNHARFSSFQSAPCWGGQTIAQGCNQNLNPATGLYTAQNLSGKPLVRAPDWSANFGLNYQKSVFDDWTLVLGSNTLFSSAYQTNLVERSDSLQGAYFKTDASIVLSTPDDQWEFAVIGSNLNDALTTGNCVNGAFGTGIIFAGTGQITGGKTSGPVGPDDMGCNVDRGRELWLRLTWRFSER
jgi:iron complex outermembrane recepter protein